MRSLSEMASAGRAKLDRKAASMSASWTAAKARMKAGYGATPFGPTRKRNYDAGIDAATHRSDPDKWQRNWTAKHFGALKSNLEMIMRRIRGKLQLICHANPEPSKGKTLGVCRDYGPHTQSWVMI